MCVDCEQQGFPDGGKDQLFWHGLLKENESVMDACRRHLPAVSAMRLSNKEARKALKAAYPFLMRKGYGYAAWQKAMRGWWAHRKRLLRWEARAE